MSEQAEGILRLAGDPPSPYEGRNGYSRVVRSGPFVLVGGTTAVGADGITVGDTPYAQTREILRKLVHEFARAGAGVDDIVQVRIYVTDLSRAEEVGRAHSEVLGHVRPVMTLVGVSGLYTPDMLVEIEATAYLGAP